MQLELDLAGIFSQGLEVPRSLQAAERAVDQSDMHQARKFLVVFSGKAGFHRVVVDMQRRRSFGGILKLHFSMAAPW